MAQDNYFGVSVSTKVTQEELNDILTAAVEGGTGYWAEVRNYKWENVPVVTVELRETDRLSAVKPGWHFVSAMDILAVLPQIAENSGQASGWNIREIVENHDAEIADIAVQLVLFGEVIYG